MQSDVKKIVETNCIDARSKLCSYKVADLASYLRKESVREQRSLRNSEREAAAYCDHSALLQRPN